MAAVACVTGATGYLAGYLIEELCRSGNYTVRGTVRGSPKAARKKLGHLEQFLANGTLSLHTADLTKDGSFHEAISGCSIVFHMASPFMLVTDNVMRDLIRPAVEGVRNVLEACSASGSVRRFVMTSSIAAVFGYPDEVPDNRKAFTEEDWNGTSDEMHYPYYYSKTLAEQTAWVLRCMLLTACWQGADVAKEYVQALRGKENAFTMVAINPGMVVGPIQHGRLSESVQLVRDMLTGYFPALPKLHFGIVDVRDVVTAHIRAAESEEAHGRYICVAQVVSMLEMGDMVRRAYPTLPIPKRELPNWLTMSASKVWGDSRYTVHDYKHSLAIRPTISSERIRKELGLKFRSTQRSLLETVAGLESYHLLEPAAQRPERGIRSLKSVRNVSKLVARL